MIVKDRQALINQLTRKKQELENRIEYRNQYNARNIIATGLIKGFKAADIALPFLASAVIVGSTPQVKKNPPFHQDLITRQASIETTDTSNGIHAYHLSYTKRLSKNELKYSTGWVINDEGRYERTEEEYELNPFNDLPDTEIVLSMTKDELDNTFSKTIPKHIEKNILSPEDYLYQTDGIIMTNSITSKDLTTLSLETAEENFDNSLKVIGTWGTLGILLYFAKKKATKNGINNMLTKWEPNVRFLSKKELRDMKKRLELEKQNLELIKYKTTSMDPCRLRKEQKNEKHRLHSNQKKR